MATLTAELTGDGCGTIEVRQCFFNPSYPDNAFAGVYINDVLVGATAHVPDAGVVVTQKPSEVTSIDFSFTDGQTLKIKEENGVGVAQIMSLTFYDCPCSSGSSGSDSASASSSKCGKQSGKGKSNSNSKGKGKGKGKGKSAEEMTAGPLGVASTGTTSSTVVAAVAVMVAAGIVGTVLTVRRRRLVQAAQDVEVTTTPTDAVTVWEEPL